MRKLPPLASLRAFEAAARHLSFQQAADELAVTPTAISHHIRTLEDACGQPLFRRRPRPLALTEAGEHLFPVLREGLDEFAAAIATVSEKRARRPLRITSPSAFASRWLVPHLPRWRETHPETPLEVIGTDAVLDLHSDEADVAIRYAASAPMECTAQELFRDDFYPVCSPDLLPGGRPVERATDLLQYPLIHFDWLKTDSTIPNWRQWFAAARLIAPDLPAVPDTWDFSFREEVHAIDAIVAGQGVAICSDVVVAKELESGALVKAHRLSVPGYRFYLMYLPNHPRQQAIQSFSDWITSAATARGQRSDKSSDLRDK